jgi:hypothetical protein
MDNQSGGDWAKDSRWIKQYRGDLLAIIVATVIATIAVFTAFLTGPWMAGLFFLGIALFLLFSLLYIAPER